jgi:hypothetical protein
VAIADGYHINAHDAGEGLIPTRVTIVGDMAKLVEGHRLSDWRTLFV